MKNIRNNHHGNDRQGLFKRWITVCILILFYVYKTDAQICSWDYFVESLYADQELNQEMIQTQVEDLYALHEQPLNINEATREQLEQLVFLTDRQIEDILYYIYRYGAMQTLGELQLIESLDYESRQFLHLFVYADEKPVEKSSFSLKDLLKEGKNLLITRLDIPLYQRDGYKDYPDSILLKTPDKKYLGNALYHSLKYQYRFRDRIYWGFQMEKDAGEPFGNNLNRIYDSYSFHFLLKDAGWIKTLALGDYKLGFGEGLVMNMNYSMGKLSSLSTPFRKQVINKHASTDEFNYFRGAAITIGKPFLETTCFYSYRKQDAVLNDDGTISSMKSDGYHRTWLEYSRKKNVCNQMAGMHVDFYYQDFHLGATAYYQHLDHSFSTGDKLYRQYYQQGNTFWGGSLDYGLRWQNVSFFGETAYSGNRSAWASLNKLIWQISPDYRLMGLQRFFSYRYYAMYANAFSEGSDVRNESGFYLGFEATPRHFWKLSAYVDYFYSPWPRYGLSHSSDGFDGALRISYQQNRRLAYYFQHTFQKKEKFDQYHYTNRTKVNWEYTPSEHWRLQGNLASVVGRKAGERRQWGFLLGQTTTWRFNDHFRSSWVLAYIQAKGSLCSLSYYEPGLLNTFSFSSFYETAYRTAWTVRADIGNNYMLIGKYGMSYYPDAEEIGSGRQRIEGKWKNDVYLQLRIKF